MRSVPRGDSLFKEKIEVALKKVCSKKVERSFDVSYH
jgi:hypothetical protein